MTTAIRGAMDAPMDRANHSGAAYRCMTYEDDGAFILLRRAWDALADADREASIFQSCTWLKHLWRLDKARRASLRLVAVWDGEQLVGLAPWMTDRAPGILGTRRLCFVGQGACDQHGVLVADHANESAVMKRLAGWLQDHSREYDMICWDELAAGSRLLRYRRLFLPLERGWGRTMERASTRRLLHPYRDAGGVVRSLSKSSRNSVRRRWRRLEEDFELAKEIEDGSREPARRIAELIGLHQQRRAACGDRGLFRTALRRDVFTDLFMDLLAQRRMLLAMILLDGKVKVVNAMLCDGAAAVGYNMGMSHEPRLGRYALGIQCAVLALEASCEHGATQISLGRGDQNYKRMFPGVVSTNRRLICRRRNMRTFDAAVWRYVGRRMRANGMVRRMYGFYRQWGR